MFAALKRLTDKPPGAVRFPMKVPFLRRDWTKTMHTLEAKIETLQTAFDVAVRDHADACLAAMDDGADEIKARDKAQAAFVKAERKLADARAALTAASRRKDIEDQKDAAKEIAAQQERVTAKLKGVSKTCITLDDLLDQVAVAAIILRDQTAELRLEGVRDAQRPIVNLDRALGSRLRRSGLLLGMHHPFDDAPLLMIDMVPDLAEVIAVSTRRLSKKAA